MSENKNLKDIKAINEGLISKYGVQALSDKPNRNNRYGEPGLTASELKERFDNVPEFIIKKFNELLTALQDKNLSENINVKLSDEETKTLAELGAAILSGALSELLIVKSSKGNKPLDEWAEKILKKLDRKALVHYKHYSEDYPDAYELTNEGAGENGKLTKDKPYTVFGVDTVSLCKYRPREGEEGYNAEDVTGTVAALGPTGFKKLYDVDGARGKGLMTVTEKGIHFELLKRDGNKVSRDITLGELLFPLENIFLEKSLTIATKEQSDKDYLHKTVSGTEDVAVVMVDEVGNTFAETPFKEPRANAIVKRDENGDILVRHPGSSQFFPATNEQRTEEIVFDYLEYFQEASLPRILSPYALKSEISRVYRPWGSVPTYDDLPTPEHLDIGDVYSVDAAYGNYPADTNYVWLGDRWDALGGHIDLSGYVKKEDFDESVTVTDEALDKIIEIQEELLAGNIPEQKVYRHSLYLKAGEYEYDGVIWGSGHEQRLCSIFLPTDKNLNISDFESCAMAVDGLIEGWEYADYIYYGGGVGAIDSENIVIYGYFYEFQIGQNTNELWIPLSQIEYRKELVSYDEQ